MFKRAGVVAVFLLVGCGSESRGPQAPPDLGNPPSPLAGSVSFTTLALTGTVGPVKIVVDVTEPVYTAVTVYDPNTDTDVPVACANDAACTAYAGATCRDSVCETITGYSDSIMYVRNQSGANRLAPVVVPCDGRSHRIEVYATDQALEPFLMTDMKISAPFTMTSSPSSCTAPAETSAANFYADRSAPTLAFPTIYVGLPAPYDRYAVQAQNLTYPFSSTWSVLVSPAPFSSAGAQSPLSYSRAGATFAAPTANGSLDFRASFYLDRSLLVAGEGATAWTAPVPASATPVSSVGVPLP